MRQLPGGLGVVRIHDQQVTIGLERLIEPVSLKQREAFVEQDFDEVRPAGKRLVEPLQSLFVATEPEQRVADIIAGDGIGGIERVRPPGVRDARLVSLQAA